MVKSNLVTLLVLSFLLFISCGKTETIQPDSISGIKFYVNNGDEDIEGSKKVPEGFLFYGASNSEAVLILINNEGEQVWYATVGTIFSDFFYDAIATSDGGYLAAGKTRKESLGANDDSYLVKFDKNGEVEWEKTYGMKDYADNFYAIQEDSKGNIIAGGYYQYSALETRYMKLSSQGDSIWERYISVGSYHNFIKAITLDPMDNIILAGYCSMSAIVYEVRRYLPYALKVSKDSGDFIGGYIYNNVSRKNPMLHRDVKMDIYSTDNGFDLILGTSRFDGKDIIQILRLGTDMSTQLVIEQSAEAYTKYYSSHQFPDGGYFIHGSTSDEEDYQYEKSVLMKLSSGLEEDWTLITGSDKRIQRAFTSSQLGDLYMIAGVVLNSNSGAVNLMTYVINKEGELQNRE